MHSRSHISKSRSLHQIDCIHARACTRHIVLVLTHLCTCFECVVCAVVDVLTMGHFTLMFMVLSHLQLSQHLGVFSLDNNPFHTLPCVSPTPQ